MADESDKAAAAAAAANADTRRLGAKKQTLDDAYAAPANFLEIDVVHPETHGIGKKRYTDYEVRMKVGVVLRVVPKTLWVVPIFRTVHNA